MPPIPTVPPQRDPWELIKFGKDMLQLVVTRPLTREETFRLLGQLERLASSL